MELAKTESLRFLETFKH
jgi:T-complex protein 1 subunit zeta